MLTIPSPTLHALPKHAVDGLAWEPLAGCVGVAHKAVYLADDVVAGLLRLRPGAQEVPHLHGHGEHHIWVLEGSVVVDETDLPTGSYLHVAEHLVHTLCDGGDGSLIFYVFCRPL